MQSKMQRMDSWMKENKVQRLNIGLKGENPRDRMNLVKKEKKTQRKKNPWSFQLAGSSQFASKEANTKNQFPTKVRQKTHNLHLSTKIHKLRIDNPLNLHFTLDQQTQRLINQTPKKPTSYLYPPKSKDSESITHETRIKPMSIKIHKLRIKNMQTLIFL
jgi:hypothetical protein